MIKIIFLQRLTIWHSYQDLQADLGVTHNQLIQQLSDPDIIGGDQGGNGQRVQRRAAIREVIT